MVKKTRLLAVVFMFSVLLFGCEEVENQDRAEKGAAQETALVEQIDLSAIQAPEEAAVYSAVPWEREPEEIARIFLGSGFEEGETYADGRTFVGDAGSKEEKVVTAMDGGRALCSMRFVSTVILMVLMEALSASMMLVQRISAVDEILDNLFAGTGSATVLLMLLPLLPYAMSYAGDMEGHALEFYMVRSGTGSFVAARFLAVVLSAFACVVASFALFAVVLLCIGHPVSHGFVADVPSGYEEFMGSNTALYLLCYTADRGLSAVMMAACAVFLSVVYPHPFFAVTAPVCMYFLSERLIFPTEVERVWLTPVVWIEGVYSSPSGGFATLLCKVGVAALVCLAYGGLAVAVAKRRWHYA